MSRRQTQASAAISAAGPVLSTTLVAIDQADHEVDVGDRAGHLLEARRLSSGGCGHGCPDEGRIQRCVRLEALGGVYGLSPSLFSHGCGLTAL